MFDSAAVIVGFEIITERPDWKEWFARKFQMCQWTMAAAPGHDIFKRVIANIKHTFETASDETIESTRCVCLCVCVSVCLC